MKRAMVMVIRWRRSWKNGEDLWSDPYCGSKNKPAILGDFLELVGNKKLLKGWVS